MNQVKYPLALIATFIWIGFVCAISFMEAWLKFRAPGINIQLGLGIGRIIFAALNKVEWVLAIAIIMNYLMAERQDFQWSYTFYIIPLLILGFQTAYLLPALDARAEMIIRGLPVEPSSLHFIYVGIEVLKVMSLIIFGLKLFKR
jgi:uncharacterized membrane protein (DUF485 family)